MAPKTRKGKGVAKDAGAKEPPESELAARQTQSTYFPTTVDAVHLWDYFKHLSGCKMGGDDGASGHARHPCCFRRSRPESVPILRRLLFLRPLPPFSDFFNDIMHTYGFHLLDFTPNAVACMALFAHLYEGFTGVHPNTALFRHYFSPWIQK